MGAQPHTRPNPFSRPTTYLPQNLHRRKTTSNNDQTPLNPYPPTSLVLLVAADLHQLLRARRRGGRRGGGGGGWGRRAGDGEALPELGVDVREGLGGEGEAEARQRVGGPLHEARARRGLLLGLALPRLLRGGRCGVWLVWVW